MFRLSLLLVTLGTLSSQAADLDSLKQYHWKNRILVANDRSQTQKNLNIQAKWLKEQPVENTERALLFIERPQPFPEQDTDFYMLLIGYDGGVKAKFETPTKMAEIYKIIDAMPMRQKGSEH
jgi:hypothetical protein